MPSGTRRQLAEPVRSGAGSIMPTAMSNGPRTTIESAALGGDRGAAGAPERLLLDAIADGELDHSLHALADAVHARLALLQTIKAASALAHLNVGDIVRLNHKVRPRYLQGARG